MPLPVYRLRRLLAATALLLTAVVVGMYLYARSQTRNVLKSIPNKIGIDVKQTASGFQISKSDGKRTLFTVQASSVKQFKLNGNAELHNVSIILYGRDSSRFDQIYGENFAYNQKTGNVTAQGEVQIDLVANPAGMASPDQATPKALKNPIHLKTRDLVFNKDTGNASTDARVEVLTPQASGWAIGVKYSARNHVLTLPSQIHLTLIGPEAAVIEAQSGVITNEPREIVLEHPHVARDGGTMAADRAIFHLSQDNHVDKVLAEGNVRADTRMGARPRSASASPNNSGEPRSEIHAKAEQAEFLFVPAEDVLRTATLSGKVHLEQIGGEPIIADAGRVILDFSDDNRLQKVQALDGAHLKQTGSSTRDQENSPGQDFDLTAPVIDFKVVEGHILRHANTSGPAQITIVQSERVRSTSPAAPQKTVITAGRFDADFSDIEGRTHLARVHGAPTARIMNSSPGQPERVSISDSVDASFLPQGGLEVLTQLRNIHYTEHQAQGKQVQAWATSARYTPRDQMLVLNGNPRVQSGGMATTADRMRINRMTGEALAEGEVKSTYSELREQPSGALLASSSPIHVTASSMTAHSSPSGIAVYSGNARLWQDANMIEAPRIQFDRDHRSVLAQGTAQQTVRTTLVESGKNHASQREKDRSAINNGTGSLPTTPISITALKLTYTDSERKIHYQDAVAAKAPEFSASANAVDAYLLPRSQTASNQSVAAPGQLDRMIAQGNVLVQQPNRRAEGQNLVYTAAEDKFVLTGGPPSIFDAEQGKITGVSLTFFRRDDRVLVEGEASHPVVTQTRVAR
jgi:lipopolysaccharide export system protein LptA